jgi:hypothetical protein
VKSISRLRLSLLAGAVIIVAPGCGVINRHPQAIARPPIHRISILSGKYTDLGNGVRSYTGVVRFRAYHERFSGSVSALLVYPNGTMDMHKSETNTLSGKPDRSNKAVSEVNVTDL